MTPLATELMEAMAAFETQTGRKCVELRMTSEARKRIEREARFQYTQFRRKCTRFNDARIVIDDSLTKNYAVE
jgi:hypothetical protein